MYRSNQINANKKSNVNDLLNRASQFLKGNKASPNNNGTSNLKSPADPDKKFQSRKKKSATNWESLEDISDLSYVSESSSTSSAGRQNKFLKKNKQKSNKKELETPAKLEETSKIVTVNKNNSSEKQPITKENKFPIINNTTVTKNEIKINNDNKSDKNYQKSNGDKLNDDDEDHARVKNVNKIFRKSSDNDDDNNDDYNDSINEIIKSEISEISLIKDEPETKKGTKNVAGRSENAEDDDDDDINYDNDFDDGGDISMKILDISDLKSSINIDGEKPKSKDTKNQQKILHQSTDDRNSTDQRNENVSIFHASKIKQSDTKTENRTSRNRKKSSSTPRQTIPPSSSPSSPRSYDYSDDYVDDGNDDYDGTKLVDMKSIKDKIKAENDDDDGDDDSIRTELVTIKRFT
ncbi:hypothetical protein HELRODRAFT_172232 [Helobdella robusta]|uniref:Uncharacterized protein n=1 Tax=Helobdella robusta TaxID=6412 RepID=T1F556_HELRO|nr:hypothetical protein HELRODRAFT_172232 [Helobdella robusta]ESO04572.1 hypothetical protein HELRODRAFT_172232 [Helobdella robusta]